MKKILKHMIRDDEEEGEIKRKREMLESIVLDYEREHLSIHQGLDTENFEKEFDLYTNMIN